MQGANPCSQLTTVLNSSTKYGFCWHKHKIGHNFSQKPKINKPYRQTLFFLFSTCIYKNYPFLTTQQFQLFYLVCHFGKLIVVCDVRMQREVTGSDLTWTINLLFFFSFSGHLNHAAYWHSQQEQYSHRLNKAIYNGDREELDRKIDLRLKVYWGQRVGLRSRRCPQVLYRGRRFYPRRLFLWVFAIKATTRARSFWLNGSHDMSG